MAAKNLDEAIKRAMMIGKASEFPVNMKNEFKDFLSHQVMSTLGTKPTDDEANAHIETIAMDAEFKKIVDRQ